MIEVLKQKYDLNQITANTTQFTFDKKVDKGYCSVLK